MQNIVEDIMNGKSVDLEIIEGNGNRIHNLIFELKRMGPCLELRSNTYILPDNKTRATLSLRRHSDSLQSMRGALERAFETTNLTITRQPSKTP